jgi:hypothetical protein
MDIIIVNHSQKNQMNLLFSMLFFFDSCSVISIIYDIHLTIRLFYQVNRDMFDHLWVRVQSVSIGYYYDEFYEE